MKRAGARDLPAVPQKGERITVAHVVVFDTRIVQARVEYVSGARWFTWSAAVTDITGVRRLRGSVRRRDEGRVWVRGWDSDEAKAFAVEVALR